MSEQAFGLNVEKILERWFVSTAIRRLIANALDEQMMTSTAIDHDRAGRWHVVSSGRGVRHGYLTQDENAEKRRGLHSTTRQSRMAMGFLIITKIG